VGHYAGRTVPQTAGSRPEAQEGKDKLLAQSIQPIQQFAYTRGKNSTDAAMVIDAMDLLYSGRFDGFCIVSSDSDFTRRRTALPRTGERHHDREAPLGLLRQGSRRSWLKPAQHKYFPTAPRPPAPC
jgi:NYN domain